MNDSKTLAILLEFVQSPLVEGNYHIYKFDPQRVEKSDPELTEQIVRLGEATERALEHLAENGIHVIAGGALPPYLTSSMLN